MFRLSLAKALEEVEAQRSKILGKSRSQSLAPLSSTTTGSSAGTHNSSPKKISLVQERAAIRQKRKNLTTDDPRFLQDLLFCECGEELHPPDRRLHFETECALRMIRCPRPGCLQSFQANHKQQHDQMECQFARHSRTLLRDREDGDTLVDCEICHDQSYPIRKRYLQRHQLHMCIRRMVSCRFAEWGCGDKFPFDERETHEAEGCVVAKRRQQIAADAALVNEETVCDWCQQTVKKRHLLDHQEDECLERERPCPNAVNGCSEWVPVGKFEEHLRTVCSVTLERNALAARAREKNTPVLCKECGLLVKLRLLDRHWREECVSRVVTCRNANHGCRARLRWRDRHLHEDFMALSKDRSMIQFQTGGTSYIAVHSSKNSSDARTDLAPPWTAEYFVWMVDAEEEILDLMKTSLLQMEIVVVNTRENQRWQQKFDACKKKLKELKQLRKQKSGSSANQQQKRSGADVSTAAKDLADEFNASENGVLTTQQAVALAKGWVQIFIMEAMRIFQEQNYDEDQSAGLKSAIANQTAQVLQDRTVMAELLSEADLVTLSDLEAWARSVAPGGKSSAGSANSSSECEQKVAEQKKLLKKRAELQDVLAGLAAVPGGESGIESDRAETERLRRRYERDLDKVDAKLALVSGNTPTQLLERRGRHIVASSTKNAISLVAGATGQVTFYRSVSSSSKAAREVPFDVQLERNRWNHVAFCASTKELSVILNGELKAIKRGVFDLPFSNIGASDEKGEKGGGASFQGFIQEIRYWRECRSAQQIQKRANAILHVAKCKELAAYWTFEEGMGDLVDDMSLSLPRSPCFHTSWVLYNTPAIRKRFGIPPTPSLRDQTCCFINQKLKVLAQRARDREHDVVTCRQHCGETIPLSRLDVHHRLACKHRMVVCKEIGCGHVYRFVDELQHLNETCERHLYREKLLGRYKEKEELELCLLNCGLEFKKRVSEAHYHHECLNRFITCPRRDCEETIVAKTLDEHLLKNCRSPSLAAERQMVANARTREKEKRSAAMQPVDNY